MKVRFASRQLEALFFRGADARRYPPGVVNAFNAAVAIIASAASVADLYEYKGLHFEKLIGDRIGERSLRFNRRWRLVIRIDDHDQEPEAIILDIVDYH